MMKVFIFILVFMLDLSAMSPNEIVGKWQAVTHSMNNGTATTEKEYLYLNADHTFAIVIFVFRYLEDKGQHACSGDKKG